jgi:hypothetical protein
MKLVDTVEPDGTERDGGSDRRGGEIRRELMDGYPQALISADRRLLTLREEYDILVKVVCRCWLEEPSR